MRFFLAIVYLLMGLTTSYSQTLGNPELIVFGDFEGIFDPNNPPFDTDYIYQASDLSSGDVYSITSDPSSYSEFIYSCGDHTTGFGQMAIFNGLEKLGKLAWGQTVNVVPGQKYKFSYWATKINPLHGSHFITRINGQSVSADLFYLPIDDTACVWYELTVDWTPDPGVTQARIEIQNTKLQEIGNDFAFDDISLKPYCNVSFEAGKDYSLCFGESVVIGSTTYTGIEPVEFEWSPSSGLSADNIPNPVVSGDISQKYYVTMTDAYGCSVEDSVTVNFVPMPSDTIVVTGAPIVEGIVTLCPCGSATLSAQSGFQYEWSTGETTQSIEVTQPGAYSLKIYSTTDCAAENSIFVDKLTLSADLLLPDIISKVGETVDFDLNISNAESLKDCGFQDFSASIRFNSTILLPIGNTPSGIIDASGFETISLSGKDLGDSQSFQFRVLLGNTECTDLIIDGFQFACSEIATNVRNGKVCVAELCDEGGTRLFDSSLLLSLSQTNPNPAQGLISINYSTIEDGLTQLVLYDLIGNRVATLHVSSLAGNYQALFDSSMLGAGSYIYSLITPSQVLSHQLIVLH